MTRLCPPVHLGWNMTTRCASWLCGMDCFVKVHHLDLSHKINNSSFQNIKQS
jgi:hypothetical protein